MREMRDEAVGAKAAEIVVEIAMHGNEVADFEAAVSFAQWACRMEAGRVIVTRNVKAAQGRGGIEGGKMVGRKARDHGHQRQHGFEREHGPI